jgi:hypothetical protein
MSNWFRCRAQLSLQQLSTVGIKGAEHRNICQFIDQSENAVPDRVYKIVYNPNDRIKNYLSVFTYGAPTLSRGTNSEDELK